MSQDAQGVGEQCKGCGQEIQGVGEQGKTRVTWKGDQSSNGRVIRVRTEHLEGCSVISWAVVPDCGRLKCDLEMCGEYDGWHM